MITVNSFSIARLNNQEFTALMINVKKMLRDSDTEMLGLDDGLTEAFDEKMQKLSDQVYASQTSPLLQLMHAADEKRTLLYRKVRLKLQVVDMAEEGSPLANIAVTVNDALLSKYGSRVPQMPMQEKTAVIQGFVFDLRSKLTEDDLDLLSLTEDTGKLDQANNDFVNAYSQRLAEKAEQEAQSTIILRHELTTMYQQIGFAVQFYANHPSTEMKDKTEACVVFIKLLNVAVADAKARLQQRKKKAGESDDENTDDEGGDNGSGGSQSGDNGGDNGTAGNGGGNNTSGGNTSGDSGQGTGGGNTSGDQGGDGGNNGPAGTGGNTTGNSNTSGGNTSGEQGTIHDGMMEF